MTAQLDDPRDAVIALLLGAAPERRADIQCLWEKYDPRVVVFDNACGVTLNATMGDPGALSSGREFATWLGLALYHHLGDVLVNFGDTVHEGQVIGTVGQCSSGPPVCDDHLHFETIDN